MLDRLISSFLDALTTREATPSDRRRRRALNTPGVVLLCVLVVLVVAAVLLGGLTVQAEAQRLAGWKSSVDAHVERADAMGGYVAQLIDLQKDAKADRARAAERFGELSAGLERLERKVDAMLMARGIDPGSFDARVR